jgi:hypothetical protein
MTNREHVERAASALQQLMMDSVATRESLFPDLRWAERIVEKRLRGAHLSPAVLKMARDALTDHGRLEEIEHEIRDRIASDRGATTVQPKSLS